MRSTKAIVAEHCKKALNNLFVVVQYQGDLFLFFLFFIFKVKGAKLFHRILVQEQPSLELYKLAGLVSVIQKLIACDIAAVAASMIAEIWTGNQIPQITV